MTIYLIVLQQSSTEILSNIDFGFLSVVIESFNGFIYNIFKMLSFSRLPHNNILNFDFDFPPLFKTESNKNSFY